MVFRKVKYNSGDNIIEIKIRDETGKFIENWTFMMENLPEWVDIIKRKYGIRFEKVSKELDWLR